MNFDQVAIGGISVIVLVLGIVEAAKEFGIVGKWSRLLALCLGTFFVGLAQTIEVGIIPTNVRIWIEIVVYGLGGGLAASGLFDLVRKKGRCECNG